MLTFLQYCFLFFIGSILGWILEIFFRKTFYNEWINPGFLKGPYVPIYGFGLCGLTLIYKVTNNLLTINDIVTILLMTLLMILIELFLLLVSQNLLKKILKMLKLLNFGFMTFLNYKRFILNVIMLIIY